MIGQRPLVIANEIRLWRAVHKGAFLLLEGRDDRLFYERFVDRIACKIRVVENKANVCKIIEILDADGFLGVIGVVDADFDLIEGRRTVSANLVIGDSQDLESMLVRSLALESVLVEFGSADKIERFGRDIRTTILQAAYPLACLRLYSERSGGVLRFDGLAYREFVDRRTLKVDVTALVRAVKNCSQRPDISEADLVEQIELIEREGHDPWQMCAADDLLATLSIGLRGPLGNNDANQVRDEQLRRALRLAFNENHFATSAPYLAIQQWQASNVRWTLDLGPAG
jgi:Protein of unknown function (DUF4435)